MQENIEKIRIARALLDGLPSPKVSPGVKNKSTTAQVPDPKRSCVAPVGTPAARPPAAAPSSDETSSSAFSQSLGTGTTLPFAVGGGFNASQSSAVSSAKGTPKVVAPGSGDYVPSPGGNGLTCSSDTTVMLEMNQSSLKDTFFETFFPTLPTWVTASAVAGTVLVEGFDPSMISRDEVALVLLSKSPSTYNLIGILFGPLFISLRFLDVVFLSTPC